MGLRNVRGWYSWVQGTRGSRCDSKQAFDCARALAHYKLWHSFICKPVERILPYREPKD